MIVKLPGKFCPKCGGKGFLRREKKARNTFVIVCSHITLSGNREVMTLKALRKRLGKLTRKLLKLQSEAFIKASESLKTTRTN